MLPSVLQKTNVVSATGYRVHVIPSPGASFVVPIDDVAQTSYMLNVTCEVTYQFKVQVVNENGQGANSSLVTVNECGESVFLLCFPDFVDGLWVLDILGA